MNNYIKLYWQHTIKTFYLSLIIGFVFIGFDIILRIFYILQGDPINNLSNEPPDLFAISIWFTILLGISGMMSWFNAFMNMKVNSKQIFLGIVLGGISITMSIFFALYIINIVIINICNNFFPMLNLTNTFGSCLDGLFGSNLDGSPDFSTMVFICLSIFSLSNLVGSFIAKFRFQEVIILLSFIIFTAILVTAIGFATPILIKISLVQGNNILTLFILSVLCAVSIGISYIISRRIAI
ncbi:hypothetical protein AN639_02055 [Candidatus Epulonipiscium fishelsonii]|uniref:Uncharacterized protein n=1 Tax=Candidatus Epulonipiscium fishelsonii TaxID=77094 RepID=A0ACC8XFX3_9FIRM|nr:hypothetical protein AN396_02190 [Epulopiscium sp. SCG-B11WGA-EpuloA1]ONI43858.1 hypothetical protein AN639_02055 [Epulopiscium sp. SCG-B05WGA-EpuloA1]